MMRLLMLKLSATLALWLCGCNMPTIPSVNTEPQQHAVTIKVEDGRIKIDDATIKLQATGSASAERCDCGCNQEGCRCSSSARSSQRERTADTTARSGPQIVSALVNSKPVVEMITDFDDGQCQACDLAWNDWKTNGKDWPFVLVKKRGTGGRTSPTFRLPSGEMWSPSTYSIGQLRAKLGEIRSP